MDPGPQNRERVLRPNKKLQSAKPRHGFSKASSEEHPVLAARVEVSSLELDVVRNSTFPCTGDFHETAHNKSVCRGSCGSGCKDFSF